MRFPGFTAEAALDRSGARYGPRALVIASRAEVEAARIKLPDSCDFICGGNPACALGCRLQLASILQITYGDLNF
ncbi:MAG TPA: hypothetical protein VMH28_31930 [Candidatus Acidoferrales bacterium]|nr:hypothetical protein [Candidatus Acidoferrales bacterium]